MSVIQSPEAVETANLHFKTLSKVKVVNKDKISYTTSTNLVAVSQHYGVVFIGTNVGFLLLKSKDVFSSGNSNECKQREIILNASVTHLAVDFEQKHLAVGCQIKMGPILFVYDISSLQSKQVSPIKTVPLAQSFQNQAMHICELMWQPNSDSGLTVCFSAGAVASLKLFHSLGNNEIFTLPSVAQARCLCWSPKGKQIVIGCGDGSLCQYKPDLKLVNRLNPPQLFNGAVTVVNVHWISTFQFAAAYKDAVRAEEFPVIVIVNSPKNEPIKFVNFDDITYSSVHFRAPQIYFYHQSAWNLMYVASASGIEVAVLHMKEDNSWEQWFLGDASRAELPLNAEKSETFPLGFGIDFTNDQVIPWGEDALPPMPRLLLLSSEGILTTFNIINTTPNVPQLCSPAKLNFDDSLFTVRDNHVTLSETNVTPVQSAPPPEAGTAEAPKPPTGFSLSTPFTSLNLQFASSQQGVIPGQTTVKAQNPKQQVVLPVQSSVPDQQQQQQVLSTPQANTSWGFQTPQWGQNPLYSTPLAGALPAAAQGIALGLDAPKTTTTTSAFGSSSKAPSLFDAVKPSAATLEQSSASTQPKENLTQQRSVLDSNVQQQQGKTVSLTATTTATTTAAKQQVKPLTVQASGISESKSGNGAKTPETSRATPDVPAVDESVYVTALLDEIDHFNGELKDLIRRVSTLKVHIGTEEEKTSVRETTDKLNKFQKALYETTVCQKNEIQSLQAEVIEAFAWYEDARSRNHQRKSPTFIELRKSEELNPLSNKLRTEIIGYKYYIENQLKQLNSYLMKEWMVHQGNSRLEVKTSMVVPSVDELYRAMHLQLVILNKQRSLVEELRKRVAEKNLKYRTQTAIARTATGNYSTNEDNNRVTELCKLADNLLQMKISRDEQSDDMQPVNASQLIIKNLIGAISEKRKKFNSTKQNTLRDVLTEREMMKTRSVKSTLESSSFIRNASARVYSKFLSSLKEAEEAKAASAAVKLALATSTPQSSPQRKPQAQEKEIINHETKSKPDQSEVTVSQGGGAKQSNASHSFGTQGTEPKPLSFSFFQPATSSAKTEKEKPPALVFTYTDSKSSADIAKKTTTTTSTTVVSTTASITIAPKPAPFVFNAAPVSATTTTASSAPAPAPKFSIATSSQTIVSDSTVTSSRTESAPLFSFKAAPSITTTTTTTTFSFSTSSIFGSKTVADSTPKIDVSIFSAPTTTVKTSVPAPSIFSFSSRPATTTSAEVTKLSVETTTPVVTKVLTEYKSTGAPIFGTSTPLSTPATPSASTTTPPDSASSSPRFMSTPKTSIFKSSFEVTTSAAATTDKASAPLFGQSLQKPASVIQQQPPSVIQTSQTTVASQSSEQVHDNVSKPGDDVKTESQESGEKTVAVESVPASSAEKTPATETVKTAADSTAPVVPKSSLFMQPTFGTPAPADSSTSNIFGLTPGSGTTSAFELTASQQGKSIFGMAASAAPASTGAFSASIFSSVTTATTTASDLFKSTPTVAVTAANIFGQVPPSATAATTVTITTTAAAPSSTSTTSTFGQPEKDEVAKAANLFGEVLGSSLSGGSMFNTQPTNTSGNIFGKTNIFGTKSTESTSIFGSPSTNIFSQAAATATSTSAFGQVPQSSSTGSIFGQPQAEAPKEGGTSIFGQNICSPAFGSSTAPAPNQNPFASSSTGGFGAKPVFGQSLFGQSTSTNLFAPNSSSSTNMFGGSSTSSLATSSSGNIFQNASSSFGSSPGLFSGGGGAQGAATQSSSPAFQKPIGGFGGAPVFGSSLAPAATFGAPPTFGAAPMFGGPPTFGSPQKVFGSPQGSFGQSQSNAPSFESLEQHSFANLAQQSPTPAFGGNTFTQNRNAMEGNSFSVWRK